MRKLWTLSLIVPLTMIGVGQEDCETDGDQDGWSTADGDCNDRDATVHPGADELCDGIDNDCDDVADGGVLGGDEICAAESCAAILAELDTAESGAYWLSSGDAPAAFQAYCDMSTHDGGWTLLLKVSGDESYYYDDPLWTDTNLDNESDVSLDAANAKYASFLYLPFTTLMGCFPTEGESGHCVTISVEQQTAYALFNGDTILEGYGDQFYEGWSTQPYCQNFGINTPYCYRRTRFGFTANQENDCSSNDTAIGFGLANYCHDGTGELHGAGEMCLSSGCSLDTVNRGFQGYLYGR